MQHTLASDKLEVRINLAGAEVNSVKNKSGLEFMWQAKKDVWPRHAPVLFPIVGKLKETTFMFKGSSYTLGQHGFARDHYFELVAQEPSSCLFELRANKATKKNYPFDFIFQIGYVLEQNTLSTQYKIVNPSDEVMFFSVGAHPGFKCPLLESETFGNYYLEFEHSHYELTALNNGLRKENKHLLRLDHNRLYLSKTLFDNDALVFENTQIGAISLCSDLSPHKISMRCNGWPYFGIWSKKGCEEFVCLEPWHGIADGEHASGQLQEKEGMIRLEAGAAFNCSFSVSFT